VPTEEDAGKLLKEFSEYADVKGYHYLNTGIDALWGRAAEHAYKIALICACAEQTCNPSIELSHAQWAIHFVGHYVESLALQVKERIADTDFERLANDFYLAIKGAGERGFTERDMNRVKPFCSQAPKDRKPIVETLLKGGRIALTQVQSSGAGRPRVAYVACDLNNDENDE